MSKPATTQVWLDSNTEESEIMDFGLGVAAVYSRRCPGKESSNEDGAIVAEFDGDRIVLAVADGCGGMNAGAEAARITLQVIEQTLASGDIDSNSLRAPILDSIEQANSKVLALGIGAATTLAIAEVYGNSVRTYHVGDSQIALVGNHGKIKFQTSSHSPVGYAIEAGLLSEDEAMYHEDRHIVSNVIGSRDVHIEVGSHRKMSPRDTLILATDGVFDNLHLDEVTALIRKGPLTDAAKRLASLTRSRTESSDVDNPNKPDDSTFILFRTRVR